MLNSSNSSSLVIIQKYILLATGMQNSVVLRSKVVALHEQLSDFDQLAKLADTFMTELEKNSDYNSSQTASAAREWLANIRATDESLATSTEAIQSLVDNFNEGNIQSTVNTENRNSNKSPDKIATTTNSSAGDDRNILII